MPSSTTRHSSPPVNAALPARVNGTARRPSVRKMERFLLLVLGCLCVSPVKADSLSPPVNVTIKAVKANSAVVTWDIPEGWLCHHTAEERRAHAAIHPGSQHHHMLLCIMGLGGGDRLHYACPVHQHVQDEPTERTPALQAETQASKSKGEVAQRENTQTRKYKLLSHPAHPHTRPSTQEPSLALGFALSPLLYSLYTPDCMAMHSSNLLVKFADNTTAIS